MKTLLNVGNGALVITEQGGNITISISKSAQVGGGSVAGILTAEGEGSITVKGKVGFDAGMKLLEAHSPAPLVAMEEAGQALADAALDKA